MVYAKVATPCTGLELSKHEDILELAGLSSRQLCVYAHHVVKHFDVPVVALVHEVSRCVAAVLSVAHIPFAGHPADPAGTVPSFLSTAKRKAPLTPS